MVYSADTFVADEQPTTAKWNKLWSNDASFNDGSGIADDAILTRHIADDNITAPLIDWASTGANGGIWEEELGRTTLGVAGDTLSVTGLPARKYLKVRINTINTGGTNSIAIRFNGDSGANYTYRNASAGGADTTAASATELVSQGAGAWSHFIEMEVLNVAAREKAAILHSNALNAVGAANVPGRLEHAGKWSNTADAISRIDVLNLLGTGDYAIGSEIVVTGHN